MPILTDNAHGAARIEDIDGDELISVSERKRWRWSPASRAFTRDRPHHHARPRRLGTSAVAIAAAHRADRCDIYTDVDGVYTTDPRVVRGRGGYRRQDASAGEMLRSPRSAPRCCKSARSRWRWCIMSTLRALGVLRSTGSCLVRARACAASLDFGGSAPRPPREGATAPRARRMLDAASTRRREARRSGGAHAFRVSP